MRFRVLGLALFLAAASGSAAAAQQDYSEQVVELEVTHQSYDPVRPWSKGTPRSRFAFGAVVEGNLVLTSAQMVGDATLIQTGKKGGAKKANARVVHVDPEVNLALLTTDEPGFFDDLRPVRLARKPVTEGAVSSVRWRGGQLDVSTSRVARAEVRSGHTSDLEHVFLLVKSDLAGGGWSEPVFAGRDLAGLTVAQDEDLARVLPAHFIGAYLKAVAARGGYPGFGALGVSWQVNRDPALASYLGLQGEPRGVVILKTAWGGSACGTLKPRDILLALDGNEIDAEGFYRHPVYGRLRFTNVAVEGHLAGDSLKAQVLRGGQVHELQLKLKPYPGPARLVPGWRSDHAPPYLVAGGLVFRELDLAYLMSSGKDWRREADSRLMAYWELEQEGQRPGRRRIVLVAYVLPTEYTIGYQGIGNLAVASVNGREVSTLSDVAEALRSPRGGFHTVVLQPNGAADELVLDAASLEDQTQNVLKVYGIPQAARLETAPLPDLGEYCGE